jgi:hypothetical protein
MADEIERDRARQRTHDALERKARRGHVTGGRVFGCQRKGKSVCSNSVVVPLHDMEDAMLSKIEAALLHPAAVARAVALAEAELTDGAERSTQIERIRGRREELRVEPARLVDAKRAAWGLR